MINITKKRQLTLKYKKNYEIVPEITNAILTPKQMGEKRYS